MKKIIYLFIIMLTAHLHTSAQVVSPHPTIEAFSLKFEDGNTETVSVSMDSSVIVIYNITLKDVKSIKKVHVRISSGKSTNGDLLSVSFDVNASPLLDANGKAVFVREKDQLTIRTINTTQNADNNFEVYTENYQGERSPVLNWKK